MPTPGEQPRTRSVSILRVSVALLTGLLALVLVMSQRGNLEEYYLDFTEDRKPIEFQLSDVSESWSEQTLPDRFGSYPIICRFYAGDLPADRACGVDVKSYNGVPTLFISFFFSSGRLQWVSINVPWWSHGRAYSSLVTALGEPSASQTFFRNGVRLHGWQLVNGSAVFFNRGRPFNPLAWNGIFWNSASTCAKRGCFKEP